MTLKNSQPTLNVFQIIQKLEELDPSDLHHLHQILPQMPMTMLRSTRERNGNDLQNADEQLAAVQCTNNVQGEVGIDAHGLTKEFFYLVMNCQDMVKEDTSYLKVNDAKSNEELETLGNRNDVSLLLYHAGFGNEQLLLVNKSKATQCILHRQVFMSR
ncbi:uncharacterized protein LOC114976945 isoform X4 [Acropora millepora]|uniref:uncharacterized protein LOC114976945 isoform X4 n=1 Tax=Acropora millepora TaxID=45264 RepID=UPI001CF23DB2|nr:uncharacterized protein LOC114976945 isoform X4 [Acropora millepora]